MHSACHGADVEAANDGLSGEEVILGLVKRGVLMVTEDGEIYRRNRSTGQWRRGTFTNTAGYKVIRCTSNRKSVYAYGHRIAWSMLCGPIPPGRVVNHLDGNKGNNAPVNLEVVTQRQNIRHAIDVLGVNRGERCGGAKLTESDVREIRAMREAGATYASIGEKFGISGNQAGRVARRLDWRHVA